MTRRDVPPASPSGSSSSGSSGEVEYVRRLSLAILSTLQTKGLLSADEVDAILIAARRAAQLPGAVAPAQTAPAGARPAPSMQVTVQPPGSLTWHTTPPQTDPTQVALAAADSQEAEASAGATLPTVQADGPSAAAAETLGEQSTLELNTDSAEEPQGGARKAEENADPPEQRPQPPMFDIKLD